MRTYEEIVAGILEIPRFTTKNKLEHTKELLCRLGNPQDGFKIIHVAGSNGKGSVCAYIDSVLRAAGKRTGLFTSPHLMYIEERFAVDGKSCARQEFIEASERVRSVVESMVQQGMPHPTFFEYIFAVGMVIFARYQAEFVILETGLGGRLDATNIVAHPILTVITSISLEHTELLGDTIPEIAAEKAGIIKPGVPVIYDASVPEACRVIEAFARRKGCRVYPVFPDKVKILLNTGKMIAFSYNSGYDDTVTKFEIPFGAPYQARNAAVALEAVNRLACYADISTEKIQKGFAGVNWKGRMQQVDTDVYFDGAHNADGIEKLLEAVRQVANLPGILLFSMVKEKDYLRTAEYLLCQGNWEEIVVTSVPGTRGIDSHTLAGIFVQTAQVHQQKVRITQIEDIEEAYQYALSLKKPGQPLFCAGSLYLIGELERIAGGME